MSSTVCRAVAAAALVCVAVTACAGSGGHRPGMADHNFPPGYLDDKVAAVHLSTSFDRTSQRGRAVFIKDNGGKDVFTDEGLDVSRLAHDGRASVLVADRRTDTVVGAAGSRSRGRTDDAGFFTAWLPGAGGYLALFNGGQTQNAEGYTFRVDWAGRTGEIPYYLTVAGVCDGDLYSVSSPHRAPAGSDSPARLLRTRLAGTLTTETVATWPDTATTLGTPVGQVFCEAGTAYFLFRSTAGDDEADTPWALHLASVNLATGRMTQRLVHRFDDGDDPASVQTWFDYRSAYLHEGVMYFLDGQGRIYATDVTTGQVREDVRLSVPAYTDGTAVTYWSGTRLYFLYQNYDLTKAATLTSYDITSGKQIRDWKVRGLGNLMADGMHITDVVAFD